MIWSISSGAPFLLSKGQKMNRALSPPVEGTLSITNIFTNECSAFQGVQNYNYWLSY